MERSNPRVNEVIDVIQDTILPAIEVAENEKRRHMIQVIGCMTAVVAITVLDIPRVSSGIESFLTGIFMFHGMREFGLARQARERINNLQTDLLFFQSFRQPRINIASEPEFLNTGETIEAEYRVIE
jgi:hypothetical protein